MLLMVVSALALALVSHLPATQPGLGPDEGVFLRTQADDGAQAVYFIAQGARHAILDTDLQAELSINPLWPYRLVSRDEVLAFAEVEPIGNAPTGRVSRTAVPALADADADESIANAPDAEVAETEPELTYTVQRGDTLIRIAARFGLTEDDLLAANPISNRNRIYAGQTLTIR